MRISNPGGGLGKSGDQTLTAGNLTLDNNKFFKGQNTSGSGLALLGVDTGNALELGNSSTAIQFHSSANPTYTYGSATHKNIDSLGLYVTRQASDQSVANSTTRVASDSIVCAVEASTNYVVQAYVYVASGVSPDYKFALTLPSGATAIGHGVLINASNAARYAPADATSEESGFFVGTLGIGYSVSVSTTAGNLVFGFAQQTQTDGTPAVLKAGSSLLVIKVQ